MPITQPQIDAAKLIQDAAAQDANQTVRLVAGPGTGKSFVIEGRVHWLLSNHNVAPESIIGVSFTRAASKDLRDRIYGYCLKKNQANVTDVRVSTLHSLALSVLRTTGNLNFYPADPTIMDDWEMKAIFDAEFSHKTGITSTRSQEIRLDHEAYWSTGNWNPANQPAINNPVSLAERNSFNAYYAPRTQLYSCVLPGEVIRTCVSQIQGGHIDPVMALGVQHLIVDEVQDLNQCDFDFIDLLIARGVNVFICGDDDQSVYSFRYAFPQGIQNFTAQYAGSTSHVLNECFRCTPAVLNAARGVINAFPPTNRIPKNMVSLYSASAPINNGFLKANIFNTANQETVYIANSCEALMNSGLSPKDIMILVGNKKAQLKGITDALDAINVGYDANTRDDFKDSNTGRFLLSLLRILADTNDYVAYRVLLGTADGVGIATCSSIGDKVIGNNLNYRGLFHNNLPANTFLPREVGAIDKVRNNMQAIQTWSLADTLHNRGADIAQVILTNFSQDEVNDWNDFILGLPQEITLSELKDYMLTDSQATKDSIINEIFERLNQVNPAPNPMPDKIRIMSFHSSKGLSAKVVFIPGLEESVFPNNRARAAAGLILESARLFYVAITRAKAACVLSYARRRTINGTSVQMTASRFCTPTGAVFTQQNNNSLSAADVQSIQTGIGDL